MSNSIHIANAFIVNEGVVAKGDVLIENEYIAAISYNKSIQPPIGAHVIDAQGLFLLPGVIDDQVHFREPGLTHKADIYHESRAAVAGGVTSFMDMPNTKPPATTLSILEEKYAIAAQQSFANYSFYMGVSNDNVDEVLKTPLHNVCGLKIFLGSSTGNLLVDNLKTLETVFLKTNHIIAVHCEDDAIIAQNLSKMKAQYGDDIPISEHPNIRSAEACYSSSSFAVELARKYNTRLHIFHLSTKDELALLDNAIPLSQKRITGEVCVHHLWFCSDDYDTLGTKIKWNPSIKEKTHRTALRNALNNNLLDVVATDHAPHLLSEKNQKYTDAPSGAPIVQFSLQIMLDLSAQGVVPIERIPLLMSHNPAQLFQIEKRGFIREGYFADLVLVDRNKSYLVDKEKILSKCKWSPFEGQTFNSSIDTTFINGKIAWSKGNFNENIRGMRLVFNR